MKVIYDGYGRSVEIETDEEGMTTQRLVEIAAKGWEAMRPAAGEKLGPAIGYTCQLDVDDPFRGPYWTATPHLDQGRPLDAS